VVGAAAAARVAALASAQVAVAQGTEVLAWVKALAVSGPAARA